MKYSIVVIFLSVIILSCTKTETITTPPTVCPPVAVVCDVRGTYTGTATASTGATVVESYRLSDNNFAVGALTPTGPGITFGGFRNSCDSIIISAYYNGGPAYYLLQGKLTISSSVTLSGTFKNLTAPTDFGTFVFTKQ